MTQIFKTAETLAFVKEPKAKDSSKPDEVPAHSFDSVLSKKQQSDDKPVQKEKTAESTKPETKNAKEQDGDESKESDSPTTPGLQVNPLLIMLLQPQTVPVAQQQASSLPADADSSKSADAAAAAGAAQIVPSLVPGMLQTVTALPISGESQTASSQPQTADAVLTQTVSTVQNQAQPQTAPVQNADPAVQQAENVPQADPKQQNVTDSFTASLQGAEIQFKVSEPALTQTAAVQSTVKSESAGSPLQSDAATQQPQTAQNPAANTVVFTSQTNTEDTAANQQNQTDGNQHPALKTEKTENSGSTVKAEPTAVDFRQNLVSAGTVKQTPETNAASNVSPNPVLGTQEQPASSQVSHRVLDSLNQGNFSFQMKLKPDGLGEVTVHMQVDNGKLSLAIQTGVESTHKLLLSQIDGLKAELGSGGYQLQNVSVTGVKENTASNSSFLFSGGMGSENGQNRYQNSRQQQQTSYYGYNGDVEPSVQMPVYYAGKLNYSI